jgi:hypothetical protein
MRSIRVDPCDPWFPLPVCSIRVIRLIRGFLSLSIPFAAFASSVVYLLMFATDDCYSSQSFSSRL